MVVDNDVMVIVVIDDLNCENVFWFTVTGNNFCHKRDYEIVMG